MYKNYVNIIGVYAPEMNKVDIRVDFYNFQNIVNPHRKYLGSGKK